MTKKKSLRLIGFVFPILLGIFLIIYSFSKLSTEDIDNIIVSLKAADYKWVVLSCLLAILSHLSRAYRWNYLLEPMNYSIRFTNSVFAVFMTYFLNIFIPRSGEVSRATAAQTYDKIPFAKGFGTIVIERVFDLLILGVIILTAFYFQSDLIGQYLFKENSGNQYIKWGLLALGGIIAFISYKYIRKSTHPIAVKINNFITGILEGIKSVFMMKKKGWFTIHTLFIWLMYIAMFYVVTLAFPEMSDISFSTVIIGFVVGSLSMALTNGGLGTYPIFVAEAFTFYGIPENTAIAFGWTMWTAQTAMILLLGGLSMIALPIYNRTNN